MTNPPTPPPSTSPDRRRLLVVLGLTTAVGVASVGSAAATSSHDQSHLVVADTAADALYVYRASDSALTGRLDGVDLASHAGTMQLDDGRLLYVDDAAARVQALVIEDDGVPEIVGSAEIPTTTRPWTRAGWLAVDPSQRYLVVSSLDADAASQTVTLVDLESYETHQIDVELTPDATGGYEEVHVYLAGDPLQLVVSTGGAFETFPVSAILAGESPAATSSAALGAGNHGPVVARDGSEVASTTADGVDVTPLTGGALGRTRSVAYSETRDIVTNYRPSLAGDGVSIWGVAAEDTGLDAVGWADTRNDVSVVDRVGATSVLRRIPDGLTSRLALSSTVAAVATIGGEGDALSLVDADPASATYERLIGGVALPPLSRGPVAGAPAAGTERRYVALTPDGDRAFVTQGGDGRVSVVDTAARSVTTTLITPTPLTGGGYLTVVQEGEEVTDLVGR